NYFIINIFKTFFVLIIILLLTVNIFGYILQDIKDKIEAKKAKEFNDERSRLLEIEDTVRLKSDPIAINNYCESLSDRSDSFLTTYKDRCFWKATFNNINFEDKEKFCFKLEDNNLRESCIETINKEKIKTSLESLTNKADMLSYCESQTKDDYFDYCLYSIFDKYYKDIDLKIKFSEEEIKNYCSSLQSTKRSEICKSKL
ncbi:MAG: hypothetical protein AABX16_01830, partial [Nanoarchaeota archaeon]